MRAKEFRIKDFSEIIVSNAFKLLKKELLLRLQAF
jgi:hypothetical protein